jgi:hypothetical protein
MINIFDCHSIENYLYEILDYALNANAEKISVDACADKTWLAIVTISGQEYQIKIICPEESDIQFGYKFVNIAINLLQLQGANDISSRDFMWLKRVYSSLTKSSSSLVYEPPMIGWFLPGEKYRMAIMYGIIREIKALEKLNLSSNLKMELLNEIQVGIGLYLKVAI